jgi:hypothetical protein
MSALPDAGSEDAIITYNYLRIMKMTAGLVQMPFTMPDVPSKSNIVIGAKIANGSAAIDLALSKEHLQEMMTAFQMIMQQQMQHQIQQDLPPGATVTPVNKK